MAALLDLSGKSFGRLIVSHRQGSDLKGRATWYCVCSCGKTSVVFSWRLKSGKTTSCGCVRAEMSAARGRSHSTHGLHSSRAYKVWQSLKSRCLNPSDQNYHNYGGRGITVCCRWLESFENFLEDMGHPPDGLSIERVNNDKGYSKSNCKWADSSEQSKNRRTCIYLTHNGVTKTKTDWARHIGITFWSLTKRIDKWGVEKALSTEKASK